MSEVVLQTKLRPPRLLPGLVPRPQLEARLDAARHGKLTLVSAPAGYGKSTLLAAWASRQQQPVAWLALDPGDNDPIRFWTYLVSALRTIPQLRAAGLGRTMLEALSGRQPPPLAILLAQLLNEVAAVPARHVLVLDDVHVLTHAGIQTALADLVHHLPAGAAGLHLVLAGRMDPPWPLARLRTSRELTELRTGDLRFSQKETARLLGQVLGPALGPQAATALASRTEGWIAGLQMAMISIQGRRKAGGEAGVWAFIDAFTGSHRFVLDYLMEEVLGQQPPAVQAFLLRTAVLDRFCASLCDAVTGTDDSASTLRLLEQANLFLIPLDQERAWYRYHHLFADLLRSRLQRRWSAEIPDLHRRASTWYEAADLLDEALLHALAAGDVDRGADLVERKGMSLLERSEISALARWLDLLPPAMVRRRPWLCVFDAWARYYVGPRELVGRRLQDAEEALAAASKTTGAAHGARTLNEAERRAIAGNIAALRAYLLLQQEKLAQVAGYARQALDLLPPGAFARGTSAIALAETPRQQGDLVASEMAYRQATEIAAESHNVAMMVSAMTYAGYQQAKQGRLRAAEQSYRAALTRARTATGALLPAAGLPLVKLGDLLREWNRLPEALTHLEAGVPLCLRWGHADALMTGYAVLARVHLARGDVPAARRVFAQAEQVARQTAVDPWATSLVDACRIRLWLAEDNLAAAAAWVKASGLAPEGELSFVRDLEHVNLARVLVALGQGAPGAAYLDQALPLLQRLHQKAASAGWVGLTLEILTLQALALAARGHDEAAAGAVHRALALAAPEQFTRVFLDKGLPMARLLQLAAARAEAPGPAARLLQAFAAESAPPPAGTGSPEFSAPAPGPAYLAETRSPEPPAERLSREPLAEALSARELEVLGLMAAGLTNREIGLRLSIASGTVKKHADNIYGKLGVHSRMQAVSRARQLDLL